MWWPVWKSNCRGRPIMGHRSLVDFHTGGGHLAPRAFDLYRAMARDVVLDRPARLAQEALTLQRVKALPPHRRRSRPRAGRCLAWNYSGGPATPRACLEKETLESYRVPQVDALGFRRRHAIDAMPRSERARRNRRTRPTDARR